MGINLFFFFTPTPEMKNGKMKKKGNNLFLFFLLLGKSRKLIIKTGKS